MRVSREQFAENRERILEVAGALFRERGFNGISVADLMKAAGLTHGGFYGHFESKLDLEAQASRGALEKTAVSWRKIVERSPTRPLPALLEQYLSKRHRDDPGKGCMFAALGPEAGREGEAVRSAFTEGLRPLINILTGIMPGRLKTARRRKAISALSEMIGAMILARLVDDPELSDEILAATTLELARAAEDR